MRTRLVSLPNRTGRLTWSVKVRRRSRQPRMVLRGSMRTMRMRTTMVMTVRVRRAVRSSTRRMSAS